MKLGLRWDGAPGGVSWREVAMGGLGECTMPESFKD